MTVKGNQPTLYQAFEKIQKTQKPYSEHLETEHAHGRSVTRNIEVYAPSKGVRQQWPSANSMMVRHSHGYRSGKAFHSMSYYLSDHCLEANTAASMIRQHRDIENGLHWVRDVVMCEDDSLITEPIPAINWSVLRSFALNLFRAAGKPSLTRAIRMHGHDIQALISLLITN